MISLTRYDHVIQSESIQHTKYLLYPHTFYIDAYCDSKKRIIKIWSHLIFYFFFSRLNFYRAFGIETHKAFQEKLINNTHNIQNTAFICISFWNKHSKYNTVYALLF